MQIAQKQHSMNKHLLTLWYILCNKTWIKDVMHCPWRHINP